MRTDGTDLGKLLVRDPDPLRQRAKADAFVLGAFRYVVIASLLLALFICVHSGANKIVHGILSLAIGFLAVFAVLGFFCLMICDKGTLRPSKWVPLLFVVPIVVAILLQFVGNRIYPPLFTSWIFEFNPLLFFDVPVDGGLAQVGLLTLSLYELMTVTFLVAHGVISTIAAHFRKHICRVYGYMGGLRNDGTDPFKGKFVLKLYQIPSVIDIEGVELRDAPYDNEFDMKTFTSLFASVYVLGVALSTYMFLNPVLLGRIGFTLIVMTAMALSSFLPALVIPWYNTRDTEARVKSQARDYFLWEGMKKTLYSGFFAFGLFVFFIILNLYYGVDLEMVGLTYLSYLVFMGFTATIVSFVYTNHYRVGLNNGVIDQFGRKR